jgi:hypothetical protein
MGPEPSSSGRRYKLPLPIGGTKSAGGDTNKQAAEHHVSERGSLMVCVVMCGDVLQPEQLWPQVQAALA